MNHFQLICNHFCYIGKLNLERDCSTYNYLSQSGCTLVDTIDDKKDFLVVEVGLLYVFAFCKTCCMLAKQRYTVLGPPQTKHLLSCSHL